MTAHLLLLLALADSPEEFGRAELARELARRGLAADVRVSGAGPAEGFQVRYDGNRAVIEGGDARGAMYGALALAERVRSQGDWRGGPGSGKPWLADRGLNVFLTLPWDYERNDTDYRPGSLTDPGRWWFQNEHYWRTLLDTMARSRLNWLDLHGMWDISVTDAPNLYAYFVPSARFPEVGVAPEVQAANLRRLNRVIELAHARGVRVSLMAYEARLATPHRKRPPYPDTEAVAYEYTREVVEKLIRGAPGLDAIGFRIGESGRGEAFFRCYLEAVERSGRRIPLITRSWITRKARVVPLARASADFTVEIKYNGEQWGPPYHVAGGRMAGWHSYSFEDYLSDSGPGPAARLWPGNAIPGGGRWPDQPYKVVWQVRANGTHRIFPFYEPSWVRRTIRTMPIGTATGFTVEPLNAYYPASPRYYLADPKDRTHDWIHQRDEPFLRLWGRLGYDPDTPDEVLDGEDAGVELERWKAASRIVPTAFTAYGLGPDHRSHAPELEWGGDTDDFITREPFDAHVFRSIKEDLAYAATGGRDGRRSLLQASMDLRRYADLAEAWPPPVGPSETNRIARMLGAIGRYYEGRFTAAVAEAFEDDLKARVWMARARKAWDDVTDQGAWIRPFTERLRMRANAFHWRDEQKKVDALTLKEQGKPLPVIADRASPLSRRRRRLPETVYRPVAFSWEEREGRVCVSLAIPEAQQAWLLVKPLPSAAFFHKTPMRRSGERFEADFPRENWGHLIAAEVEDREGFYRVPFWEDEAPYRVVPARAGPTPPLYSSREALTYLKPETLLPGKHGLLLVCPRAWDFHRRFDVRAQRKLLDAVSRGMKLLVLQQDYASGRYPIDWLPGKPRVENHADRVFDAEGALALPQIETVGILTQRFLPTGGWTIFGNGGVAWRRHRHGQIWLVQARLMQRMQVPDCARALRTLLALGGSEKPVVLVDAGTEGDLATAVFPDFLNAHDVPFLTLGEVIAREQGMDSLTPVPGRVDDDTVLEGRGPRALKAFLESKVKAAAARPVPATREYFERERTRRKAELLRCLGLDPLPERTPLQARVTGVLRRDGHRIEKVVFESRPGFPVTAHLYVPEGVAPDRRLPVIVNPHGHWRHKKSEPVVQARAVAQVRRGYLALVVDSPGWSFEGHAPVERRPAGPHDDLALNVAGMNPTAVYVWDLIRALDWLETRPDADLSRVGITGASGGGLATLYAFAADERFACAVPVCYATSLEVNPHNGCPCNHVPGTLRMGDRADVLAIRAPAPVLVLGAERDGEFPPEGTRRTIAKLRKTWALLGAEDRASGRLFDAGHGYDQAMREAALGFFDRHLRGTGDGSPVPEAPFTPEPPEAAELRCLPEDAGGATMRDLAAARMRGRADAGGGFEDLVALNGGRPAAAPLEVQLVGRADGREWITFVSQRGLRVPGVWRLPGDRPRAAVVLVGDAGKATWMREALVDRLVREGIACLAIDARGTGELAGLDPRLLAYLGCSGAFGMGWDAARAAAVALERAPRVAVVGRGAAGAQAALQAALLEARVAAVAGIGIPDDHWAAADSLLAAQPRAVEAPALERLRGSVRVPALWSRPGESGPDVAAWLLGEMR